MKLNINTDANSLTGVFNVPLEKLSEIKFLIALMVVRTLFNKEENLMTALRHVLEDATTPEELILITYVFKEEEKTRNESKAGADIVQYLMLEKAFKAGITNMNDFRQFLDNENNTPSRKEVHDAIRLRAKIHVEKDGCHNEDCLLHNIHTGKAEPGDLIKREILEDKLEKIEDLLSL